MKTIYLATYEGARAKLENKIIECEAREAMLVEALELIKPVLHYKNIDKRVTKAMESENFYSWIHSEYAYRVEFTLRYRTFTNGDYFESYQESIYIDTNVDKSPIELEKNIKARLEGLQEGIAQYKKELKGFKKIYNEAHKLATNSNAFQEKYSYSVLQALEI